jgi:RNA polymerase sigma-70 factor (ECF subfamily)
MSPEVINSTLFSGGATMTRALEKDLIEEAIGGSQAAYATLYWRHFALIGRIVTRRVTSHDDAQDLIQTVFIRAFQSLSSFHADSTFSTWLVRIALNSCNSHQTSRWSKRVRLDAMEDPDAFLYDHLHQSGEQNPEVVLHRKTSRALIRQKIKELPESCRNEMWLRHVEDRSYLEIARKLGKPMGTVKTHLYRGYGFVKDRFNNCA